MTRHTFGGDLSSWTTDLGDSDTSQSGQAGNVALFIPGAVVAFYTASTGGTPILDLLDGLGTATSTITSDSNGEVPEFRGPDTDPETFRMYADGSGDGSGPRRAITATDLGDVVGSNKTVLLSQADAIASLQDLVASSLGIVEYDSGSSSWPTRPADSRVYMWVGPSAPPVGGGYMQDGRDFWLSPTPVA